MLPLHALRGPPLALLRRNLLPADRAFFATHASLAKQFPPRRIILDEEIEENFLRGTGPGGQKINKTSCAVQLKHLPTGIVVKCQETRSRSQNRKIARRILGERIEETELGEQSRTAIKARERSKKKASADKKKRRKYRELDAAKEGAEGEENTGVQHHAERAQRADSDVMSSANGG
jgi:protein subunit release factor B